MSVWDNDANYIRIDGTTYRVAITSLKRKADILDKYAERTEDGVLHREVIGTYHNYTLSIGIVNDLDLYNTLFSVLSEPIESHIVELPHDHVQFEGYFSSVQDEIDRIRENGTRYKGLTCNLISVRPRRTA